ncbi:MAG: acyl-CoA dehydrogenase family protein [Burkholderiales bacterium]|nr:MAG: acyl-CoA dehydrogenase family protein [Burkholderiales bacterium]
MDFNLTEEQRLLADSVRRYLTNRYGFEQRNAILESESGISDEAWSTYAELGILGRALPEDAGGFGGGAADLMPVMEAFGECLILEPFVPTVALAGRLIARLGTQAQREQWLGAVAEGRARLALAHGEAGARYDLSQVGTRASRDGGRWRIDGEKAVVLGATVADRIVVSASTGDGDAGTAISLFLVDPAAPGVTVRGYRTVDGLRAADLELSGVQVDADAMLGDEGAALPAIEEAHDFATALCCAEAVGAIRAANAATLDYLKTRKQFGVPIGTFQALQHRMVDMTMELEQAYSMACLACSRVDTEPDAAARAHVVSAAKLRVARACRDVSQESIQLHGGMGMAEEMMVSHLFRRLTVLAQLFGDQDHHLERFAATD